MPAPGANQIAPARTASKKDRFGTVFSSGLLFGASLLCRGPGTANVYESDDSMTPVECLSLLNIACRRAPGHRPVHRAASFDTTRRSVYCFAQLNVSRRHAATVPAAHFEKRGGRSMPISRCVLAGVALTLCLSSSAFAQATASIAGVDSRRLGRRASGSDRRGGEPGPDRKDPHRRDATAAGCTRSSNCAAASTPSRFRCPASTPCGATASS